MLANKEKLLEELNKNKEKLVIVEGKKDKVALEYFGFEDIIILKKSIFETCEEVSKKAKEVIILTDLDNEGKKLYSMIYQSLIRDNVKIDNQLRNFLFKETELRQIEGLVTYVNGLNG